MKSRVVSRIFSGDLFRLSRCVALPAVLLCLPVVIGCGPGSVGDGVARYREAIAERLGSTDGSSPAADSLDSPEEALVRLPRRRLRRIDVEDQRLGPFDFLAILGCPLSEIVANRNSSLGRVLVPTLRLEHEVAVLRAADDCLTSLRADRAQRLRERVESKRRDFAAHVWNAVWLSDEVERFLTSGPRSLVGGRDPTDAPWQLKRAVAAIELEGRNRIDVAALSSAFEELRDDPAMGPVLSDVDRVRVELSRVAAMIEPVAHRGCDVTNKRLAHDFQQRYLPLQGRLGDLDRRGGELLSALDSLYRASSKSVEVPAAMQRFAAQTLDVESGGGLWMRYRAAFLAHASAWQPLLEACRLLPTPRSAVIDHVAPGDGRTRGDA